MQGILYIVSTPIGNLEDITLRAIRTLKEVDCIAAEDTRRAKILLKEYNIKTCLTSYHSYSKKQKIVQIIDQLKKGKTIALISDSGTPSISDPGYSLILEAIENNIIVIPIPGATAFVAGLISSGKTTNKFVFEGFLSNKKAARCKQLEKIKQETKTVIIYESPHRIVKFLEDFLSVLGDKEIVIARELTKKFEQILRKKVSQHLDFFLKNKPKGEFVIII